MTGEMPYCIEGIVKDFSTDGNIAYAWVENGNFYHLLPGTPCLEFEKLERGSRVLMEITTRLTYVLRARIIK